MGGFFTGLFGSRPGEEETAFKYAERQKAAQRAAELEKARERDAALDEIAKERGLIFAEEVGQAEKGAA